MQAARLPLQLDHFGVTEAIIFLKRGSPAADTAGLQRSVRFFASYKKEVNTGIERFASGIADSDVKAL
jgi:hypothetical protein